MKKIWNFIYKYRIFVVILFLIAIGGFGFIVIKSYIFPEDLRTVYGSRLDGIDDYPIDNKKIKTVETNIKKNEWITNAKVSLQGKIVNISIKGVADEESEEVAKDDAIKIMNELARKILEDFTDGEKGYYDFQIFVKNEAANYNMIGSKNKNSDEFSWSFDNIVKEVEEDEKEEE